MDSTPVTVLFILTMGVIGLMAYLGLDELLGIHRYGWRRFLSGGLTLIWSLLAGYLLMFQWLPAQLRDALGLIYILILSVAGFGIAKLLDYLLLPIEDPAALDDTYLWDKEGS
jgi:hypothetical protein